MLSVHEKDTGCPTENTDVILCLIFHVSFPEKSKPKCQTELQKYKYLSQKCIDKTTEELFSLVSLFINPCINKRF